MAKERLWKILVCCVLAVGTALLYLPVLHFDYVNYDDPLYIINNQHIRTLSWQSLHWAFQNKYASLWHPVTWISHILDFHFYGLFHPGGHHATNVVLHIFNSTLLFVILNRMTKALWPSAMVAALFAWHPLHVESVAWISERKDVLSAFFWMLTMWAYVRYTEQIKKPGLGGKAFYGLSLLFFALGLMSKPMLVTLPFVLLLLDWWPLRRFPMAGADSARSGILGSAESAQPLPGDAPATKSAAQLESPTTPAFASGVALLLEKIPFLVLSFLASLMTMRAAKSLMAPMAGYPMHLRIITATLTYLRYVKKMVWPQNLLAVYPPESFLPRNELVLASLFLVLFSITAVRLWKARPYWLVGWLWYLGVLFPVMGLVSVGAPPMSDHNTYLPSIGIFMLVCWEAGDIAGTWKSGRAVLGVIALVVLGACLMQSAKQLQYWRNPVALYAHNLEVTPGNYLARVDYAAYLRDSHQLEAAREQCEIAIGQSTNYSWAHDVLGGVYLRGGNLEKAAGEFQLALGLDPTRLDVHQALGSIALMQKKPGEAASHFSAALAYDPTDPNARCGLGEALAMQGKLDEAITQFSEALRQAPMNASAHYQMGMVLASQHKTAEALAQYRTAVELQPDRSDAMNNLAWILATDPHPEYRNGAEAVQMATRACAAAGNKSPFFTGTLAAAFAEAGRFDEAIAAAANAVDQATKAGNQPLADRNREFLALYRSHQPYREK